VVEVFVNWTLGVWCSWGAARGNVGRWNAWDATAAGVTLV